MIGAPDLVITGYEDLDDLRWLLRRSGVYLLRDAASGSVIYVGSSWRLGVRIRKHRRARKGVVRQYVGDPDAVIVEAWLMGARYLEACERAAIAAFEPEKNIRRAHRSRRVDRSVARRQWVDDQAVSRAAMERLRYRQAGGA